MPGASSSPYFLLLLIVHLPSPNEKEVAGGRKRSSNCHSFPLDSGLGWTPPPPPKKSGTNFKSGVGRLLACGIYTVFLSRSMNESQVLVLDGRVNGLLCPISQTQARHDISKYKSTFMLGIWNTILKLSSGHGQRKAINIRISQNRNTETDKWLVQSQPQQRNIYILLSVSPAVVGSQKLLLLCC